MAGVIDRIRAWAKTDLRYWEQLALEKIAIGTELSEDDKSELEMAFLSDSGLAVSLPRKPLSFPTEVVRDADSRRYRLERLFNLTNVNALPSDQEIRFGPQVTLIFGGNGAGKRGSGELQAPASTNREDPEGS